MNLAAQSRLVAAKDLRIESRSKVVSAQVLPFGGIVLILFAVALDPRRGVLRRVAPGLFWITVLLALLLAVGRSFAVESEHGARDALRLSGLDPAAIFLGKAAAVALELLGLEVALGAGVVVLFDVPIAGVTAIVPSALAATVGLAAAGTVYGVLAAGLRLRETLVPLLVLPVAAPVLLAGTRAFEAALGRNPSDAWPWVEVLVVFAAIYVTAGVLAFGALMEDV